MYSKDKCSVWYQSIKKRFAYVSHHIFCPFGSFIPKKGSEHLPDAQKQGYIFGSIIVPELIGEEVFYHSEIWLFDGLDLARSPICKLRHDDLKCGSHLHSAWIEEAESNPISYFVDVPEDYKKSIKAALFGGKFGGLVMRKQRAQIKKLFEKYIYPNFPSPLL